MSVDMDMGREENKRVKYTVDIETAKLVLFPIRLTFEGSTRQLFIHELTRPIIIETDIRQEVLVETHTNFGKDFKNVIVTKNIITFYTDRSINLQFITEMDAYLKEVEMTFCNQYSNLPTLKGYIDKFSMIKNHPHQDELKFTFTGWVRDYQNGNESIPRTKNNEKIIRKINRRFTF